MFIEVKKVTTDKNGKTVIVPEVLSLQSVRTFRKWHKGKGDGDIHGEMTFIVLRDDTNEEHPVMINESYQDFYNRVNCISPIR